MIVRVRMRRNAESEDTLEIWLELYALVSLYRNSD